MEEINKHVVDAAIAVADNAQATISIPPLGSFFKLFGRAVTSIRDEVLIENVMDFLSTANNVTKTETDNFFAALRNEKDDFIKKLIIALERMNDKEKSRMLGNLFVNLAQDKLTKNDFVRLCFVMERVYVDDLNKLRDKTSILFHQQENELTKDDTFIQTLMANGLLAEVHSPGGKHAPVKYELTSLGEVFSEYA